MGFFKKEVKKENVSPNMGSTEEELPRLPELPPLPDSTKNKDPIFPSMNDFTPAQKNMIPPIPAPQYTLEDIKNSVNQAPILPKVEERKTIELGSISKNPISMNNMMIPQKQMKDSLYIKIDKVQEAIQKFGEIKKKVYEISEDLRKIKDLKAKEDLELKTWEEEILAVKDQVNTIDNDLFNKI